MIQPSIKYERIIRAFYIPPKAKLFHCNLEQGNLPKVIGLIQEGRFRSIEEQCKKLYEVFQNYLFFPRNQRLDGIAIDFIQVKSSAYLVGVNSFKTSSYYPNCTFIEEKKVYSKKCYGVFCKSEDSFEKLIKTIKDVRNCEGHVGDYTLLYRDIANFYKLLDPDFSPTIQDLLMPFFNDTEIPRITSARTFMQRNVEDLDDNLTNLQSVQVCETCYYMYLLYKSRQQKAHCPNYIMRKTVYWYNL